MTTGGLRIPFGGPRPRLRLLSSAAGVPLLLAGAAAAGWIAVSQPEWHRAGLAIALGVNLIILGMRWPRAAALATLAFLPFLALVRRLLISESGFTSNDPLLLVGPVVALFLLYRLYVVEGRRRGSDRLFLLVAALLVVVVAQVFNPLATGGLVAALGGLLFVGVPLLWFFVGRELGDRTSVGLLVSGTIAVACVVGVYGLFQTQFGSVAPWDQTWLDTNGYSALSVINSGTGSQLRPFSTFSSNQEYASFLAIGVTFVAALLMHRRRLAVVTLPLLAVALFLAGGRGALVMATLTLVILLALRTRRWLSGLVVVVLGIAIAFAAASALGPRIDRAAGLGGDAIVERNVSGILKPLDPGKSTVITHYDAILEGFTKAVNNPAGHGTGATNIAIKLSDAKSIDSENDLSNAFLNLGLVGGLLYLAVIVGMFRTVFARYVAGRDVLVFAAAGLLVVMFGQWLNGGLYAVAPLLWFIAGWATGPGPGELNDATSVP
jgi:hypothetical protein